jgi:hypothetical protein
MSSKFLCGGERKEEREKRREKRAGSSLVARL